ncbi:uncharacterized protein G2W53_010752 [Senna tora]|uniref:Uncharacterized protein n=1 Tax=Senna tora TaxID=362788 RepID=A0A834X0H2_9FABA|nr:uncharacterized protein G2W53_010752 [Senna tora]
MEKDQLEGSTATSKDQSVNFGKMSRSIDVILEQQKYAPQGFAQLISNKWDDHNFLTWRMQAQCMCCSSKRMVKSVIAIDCYVICPTTNLALRCVGSGLSNIGSHIIYGIPDSF